MSDAVRPTAGQETLDFELAAAQAALGRGERDRALRIWASLRERYPGHAAAYRHAADVLADGDQYDEAETVLRAGRALVKTDAVLISSQFARLAVLRRDPAEALRRWQAVRNDFPEHPVGWVGEVENLRETGRLDDAATLLDALEARFPRELATPILRASLADAREDWPTSVGLWAAVRTKLPQHPLGFIKGARALTRSGQIDAAEALLVEGVQQFPNDAELLSQWAELAAHRRRWGEAAERWGRLRQQRPSEPSGYINGATALTEAGNFAEAEALIAEALARFPDRPETHAQQVRHLDAQLAMARTLSAQDRLDEAEALLRPAMDRFPQRHELFMEYAAVATRRHDWEEALRRWRDAHRRFPEVREMGAQVFEAELRVVETAEEPHSPPAPSPPRVEPVVDRQRMRSIVTQFESLGGTLHGCEFGLFQREFGAEPLGLLRWTEMAPKNVIDALEAGFAGVGLPEYTELGVHKTPNGPEYFTTDKRFLMSMHTFINETEISHEKMYAQCCRRLQFLRDKLIDDLRAAAKIFVYKITWRLLEADELDRMHAALRSYGDATLLYVQREITGKPHGTVELVKPGLMIGYIDRFSASPTGESLAPAIESWSLICERALAQKEAAVSVRT